MELKEGMYVRTETGQIGKITNFDGAIARVDTDKFITYKDFNNEITKASNNIIDLIEVGDYVNGYQVYEENGHLFTENWWVENEKIKSVVTKEMFANAEYKVETN